MTPTPTEAAYLAAVQARADLHALANTACMEAGWVEGCVGIHWRLTEKGRAALAEIERGGVPVE